MKILVTGGGGRAAMLARAIKARASRQAPVMDDRPDACAKDGSEQCR
jgi:hypothetical protein